MVKRCSIYFCDKFVGCRECRLARKIPISNLKTFSTNKTSWTDLIDFIKLAKLNDESICLKTEIDVPKEIIWELAYSSKNTLQINVCILNSFEELSWVIELSHLTEICGICCNLVIFPIIPIVVKVSDVLRIIDAVRNCKYCKILIKFAEFIKYEKTTSKKYLMLNNNTIPMEHLIKCNSNLYKCSDAYKEECYQLIKFYTDNTKIEVTIL